MRNGEIISISKYHHLVLTGKSLSFSLNSFATHTILISPENEKETDTSTYNEIHHTRFFVLFLPLIIVLCVGSTKYIACRCWDKSFFSHYSTYTLFIVVKLKVTHTKHGEFINKFVLLRQKLLERL